LILRRREWSSLALDFGVTKAPQCRSRSVDIIRRGRASVIAGLIGLALGITPTLFASPVAVADCHNPNLYFDGIVAHHDPVGSSGDVQDRQIFLCQNGTGAGAAGWVMLAGDGTYDYAQAGFERTYDQDHEHIFSEWSCSLNNWDRKLWPGFDSGSSHSYTVVYNFDSGHVQMIKGGNVLDQSGCDPAAGGWSSPWTSRFEGETHDTASDVPGQPDHRDDFSGLRTKTCRGCDWGDPDNPDVHQSIDAYKFNWINHPTHMEIWTNR
jgi:hypothetical protein